MKVLIACEESQAVCKEMRARGHEAFSADIQNCSGGHPEWHIKGDVLPIINGHCEFITEGGGTGKHTRRMGFDYCTSTLYISDKWGSGSDVSKRNERIPAIRSVSDGEC